MTKDELQRKYLLQAETPAARDMLKAAFLHNGIGPLLRCDDNEDDPAIDWAEAWRLYHEYLKELANYAPVPTG